MLTLGNEWPYGETLDAQCDIMEVRLRPIGLLLQCVHPKSQQFVELALRTDGATAAHLEPMVGTTGARLSFYRPEQMGFGCFTCFDVSLRDSKGDLLVLSHGLSLFDSAPADGSAIDLFGAGWLDPRSAAYAMWSEPFESIRGQHVGCVERESIRPGSRTETPLEVEFAAGDQSVLLYDRNAATDVVIGEQTFDIIVSDAFFRGPLNCGDCPVTEIDFLVVRSAK